MGFFIAYTFFGFLFFLLVGAIIGIIAEIVWYLPNEIVIGIGTILGSVLERIISIFFLFLFFNRKNLSNRVGVIFTCLLLGVFALSFGFIFMLIPIAYLTTIPSKEEKEPETEEEKKKAGKMFKNDKIGIIFLVLFTLASIVLLFFFYWIILLLDNILYEIEVLQILETLE